MYHANAAVDLLALQRDKATGRGRLVSLGEAKVAGVTGEPGDGTGCTRWRPVWSVRGMLAVLAIIGASTSGRLTYMPSRRVRSRP